MATSDTTQPPSEIASERGLIERFPVELLFDEPPAVAGTNVSGDPVDSVPVAAALRSLGVDDLAASTQIGSRIEAGSARNSLGGDAVLEITGPKHDVGNPPRWLLGPPRPIDRAALDDAVSQSWWFPEARPTLDRCRLSMRLLDDRMAGLDAKDRLRRVQQVLAALCSVLRPSALHWPTSEQLIEPEPFVATVRDDDFRSPLPGGFNVRFFRLEIDDEDTGTSAAARAQDVEHLMDTRGLGALGLVDLQCHFRGLDPEAVSHVLYSTGNYLFEHGRVIAAGNTVQGPTPRDAWLCRLGEALGPPEREIIDLDPGFPFAAQEYGDLDESS